MENQTKRQRVLTLAIRWTARVWSVASIVLVLAFIIGERNNPTTLTDWLGFLFFPLGICIGMILAWRREGLGGIVTIGSLFLFYVIRLAISGTFPKGWAWLAFAIPGFMFLLCWFLTRRASTSAIR